MNANEPNLPPEFVCPPIIGFCGFKRSGKTYAAHVVGNWLEMQGYWPIYLNFADPLKEVARYLFGTDESNKNEEIALFADSILTPTHRHALITLGTEWGRRMIHPEIWTRVWEAKYKEKIEESRRSNTEEERKMPRVVLVSDVRFENEVELIENSGGLLFEIYRAAAHPMAARWWYPLDQRLNGWLSRRCLHESEHLPTMKLGFRRINNDELDHHVLKKRALDIVYDEIKDYNVPFPFL